MGLFGQRLTCKMAPLAKAGFGKVDIEGSPQEPTNQSFPKEGKTLCKGKGQPHRHLLGMLSFIVFTLHLHLGVLRFILSLLSLSLSSLSLSLSLLQHTTHQVRLGAAQDKP